MVPEAEDREARGLAEQIRRDADSGARPSPSDVESLATLVESHSKEVADVLRRLKENDPGISVQDMFDMQMVMNHLSQLSEVSAGVASAANTAITSMTRNIKS
jgi:hypothetical protein